MCEDLEILVSNMNIKNEVEFNDFVNKLNVGNASVSVINQVTNGEIELTNIQGKRSIYSYHEKGLSKSRNRALQIAKKDICMISDDDVKYVDGYENIVKDAYKKFPKADVIIFNVISNNDNRIIKKIRSGKMNRLNVMKVRSPRISFKRESIINNNIKFDENFGTGAIYNNGEETIFVSDCMKKGLKVYSYNQIIANVGNESSTWFKGYDSEYFFNRGAIFGKVYPIGKYFMILQFAIRKYKFYKKNCSMYVALKNMVQGAIDYSKRVRA